ncbi:TPA: hypothetical protein DIU27_01575 [Candidatus Collierbacteria bacterium]|uniref:Uncharacterized protein n=1 Tax=Candidatus Collierbacteria bacterium GW2011_GWB2_44_22 TaxID=1618387 RepID=A0A0G1K633_9BACT|nr:MAG: hypothetical protein UW31_C0017G0015 [Candidatus Collierbacteria bacterium GW2011_GWA2_44_13]KKT48367.1 MAG: hypothetical protein UW42_C0060G0002 [Candidatus Collierbacteria bacterium GW2011_GWB1_44_197]KKT51792.1 MAG: hypothetical protein UW44_C0008G0114 [Candidatus Collierbacteria bacterium GW2011_GWB2_44_22]HCQ31058.1 hypothetical protein [Candidatus Collierbacteria bacterium]
MAKISIPQKAVPLWRQVLRSPVTIPQWETNRRDSDVRALMDLDLITLKLDSYPMCTVDLRDTSLRLNKDQLSVLMGLSSCGMCRADFVAWAGLVGVEKPLEVLKSLVELDVVLITTKSGLVHFELR